MTEKSDDIGILDCHIHLLNREVETDKEVREMSALGIEGGIVMSLPSGNKRYGAVFDNTMNSGERIEHVIKCCENHPGLVPFYWIDPTEDDAPAQVELAIKSGIKGFKIICDTHYPSDSRAMKTYHAIAANNKAIIFHCGILYNGTASAKFNKPIEFEALLEISGLRFALAHIGWPWCEEMMSLFGKFCYLRKEFGNKISEMFIDTTPGTPRFRRKDILTMVIKMGYNIEKNLLFGSDACFPDYSSAYFKEKLDYEKEILSELADESFCRNYFYHNFKRLIG